MSTFTNQTKQTAATFLNVSANAATMNEVLKAGSAWKYDDVSLTYDDTTSDQGNVVFYNGLGTQATWNNISKS